MSDNNATVKKIMLSVMGFIIIAAIVFYFIYPMMIKKELPKPVVINTQHQPTIGNPNSTIHFVVFEDLKCVNCARFNQKFMPFIKKNYIDKKMATYTMMNLAFVEGSKPAATAARCIYTQNKKLFFPFVEYIFSHQPPENQDWATIPTLMDFASHVDGIDANQLASCIVQSPYDQIFHDNMQQALKVMPNGIVSTPALYINGILVNPLTKEQIEKVVSVVK